MTPDPFVRAAQKKLISKGFLPAGSADGIAGDQTRAAIRACERSFGQPEDGTLDEKTWHLLDDGGERAAHIEADRDKVFTPADPEWNTLPSLPPIWPRQHDCNAFFGTPDVARKLAPHQTMLELPFPMRIAWNLGQTVTKIQLHEKVHDSAGRVFAKIAATYSPPERASLGLDLFGGSTNVRLMRGGNKLSMHSWGIAIDFDPIRNQLKFDHTRARLAKEDCKAFFEAWEKEGWLSLGRARDYDFMHVQAARL